MFLVNLYSFVFSFFFPFFLLGIKTNLYLHLVHLRFPRLQYQCSGSCLNASVSYASPQLFFLLKWQFNFIISSPWNSVFSYRHTFHDVKFFLFRSSLFGQDNFLWYFEEMRERITMFFYSKCCWQDINWLNELQDVQDPYFVKKLRSCHERVWIASQSTCFTYPFNVAVEFTLQLLLAPQFQKSLSILYAFSLLGKFSNHTNKSMRYGVLKIQW